MYSDSDEEMYGEEVIGIDLNSETDEDSESDEDSIIIPSHDEWHMINEATNIYLEEVDTMDDDKINNHYYIGTAVLNRHSYYIMNATVKPSTFLMYDAGLVLFYLREISLFYFTRDKIEIMKLYIHPVTNEYVVVLKTYWIRIIQRTWKRIFKERKEIFRKRCSIQNIQHRSIYGKHQYGLNVLPSLKGMIIC